MRDKKSARERERIGRFIKMRGRRKKWAKLLPSALSSSSLGNKKNLETGRIKNVDNLNA